MHFRPLLLFFSTFFLHKYSSIQRFIFIEIIRVKQHRRKMKPDAYSQLSSIKANKLVTEIFLLSKLFTQTDDVGNFSNTKAMRFTQSVRTTILDLERNAFQPCYFAWALTVWYQPQRFRENLSKWKSPVTSFPSLSCTSLPRNVCPTLDWWTLATISLASSSKYRLEV